MPLSLKFFSHESNQFEPAQPGCQNTFLFNSRIFSIKSSTLKNHCFVVLKTTGLWQRQQWAYSCSTGATVIKAFFSFKAAVNFLSSFFAVKPENFPIEEGKTPVSLMLLNGGRPSLCPTS